MAPKWHLLLVLAVLVLPACMFSSEAKAAPNVANPVHSASAVAFDDDPPQPLGHPKVSGIRCSYCHTGF